MVADPAPTPALQSMTGFARLDGAYESPGDAAGSWRWVWEMRSVNNRGLDVKLRLPSWLDRLEPALRALVPSRINRGSVTLNLQVQSDLPEAQPRLDEAALAAVIEAAEMVSQRTDCTPPAADGLLALKGVLVVEDREIDEDTLTALGAAITESFQAGLEGLANARIEEGARIAEVLSGQVDTAADLTTQARSIADGSPEAIRKRITDALADLKADGVSEDRLAQEVALLAVRADIREELDRLEAHVASARELLAKGSPVGRKLDFLVQEFNREANTLCSKAQSIELKQVGLDLKSVIDQLREQIQNVE